MSTTDLTVAEVETSLKGWYAGPKSPGLIILEHELTNDTVGAFINTWPSAVQAGWKPVSVAQLDGTNKPYQNAQGSTGQVNAQDIVLGSAPSSTSASASSSSTASAGNNAGSKSSTASSAAQSSGSTTKNGTAADTKGSGAVRFEALSAVAALSMLVVSAVIVL